MSFLSFRLVVFFPSGWGGYCCMLYIRFLSVIGEEELKSFYSIVRRDSLKYGISNSLC